MNVQITKQEARDRVKSKVTSVIGIPLLIGGLFMFGSTLTFFIHHNPDLKFEWSVITLMIGWGFTLFAAKDTIIKGMIGLLLPRKK